MLDKHKVYIWIFFFCDVFLPGGELPYSSPISWYVIQQEKAVGNLASHWALWLILMILMALICNALYLTLNVSRRGTLIRQCLQPDLGTITWSYRKPHLWCWDWQRYWLKEWVSSLVQAFLFREIPVPSPMPSSPSGRIRRPRPGTTLPCSPPGSSHWVPPFLLSATSFRPASTVPDSPQQPLTSGFLLGGSWYPGKGIFGQENHSE